MKQYPGYKDSGIEWIGKIPVSWTIKKLKWVCVFNYGESLADINRDIGSVQVFGSNGVIGYHNIAITSNPCIIVGRKGSYGKINYSYNPCFPIDTTFFIDITSTKSNLRWLYYSLKLLELDKLSKDSAVPGLSREDAYKKIIPLPSIDIQKGIAYFLDRKTTQIDELINKKQRLIELLKEQRAAVINRAVTKGLNPNAPMKDSGIEWLGKIPQHWEIKKLKYICVILGRIGFRGYKSSDLVPKGEGAITLGATHITKDNKISLLEPVYISWEKYYESPEIMVKKNDIVFSQRGAYLGKVGLIELDYGDMTINPSLILLKEIKINSGYLSYYLSGDYIRKIVDIISSSTAIPMISQEQLSNFICLLPPISEQTAIKEFIEKETLRIDRIITKTEKEIELLKEYRTALISEAVTGKIDVRDFGPDRNNSR